MALEWIGPVAPAIATIVAGSFGLIRSDTRLRRNFKQDVETLEHLPDSAGARVTLLAHIEWEAKRLVEQEQEGSRSWRTAIDAALLALGFGYASVWVYFRHWSFWFSAPLMIAADVVMIVNLFRLTGALTIQKRDKRGRIIG